MMFFRVVRAEMEKIIKQQFFTARTLFWTLALPLGNGLYMYFFYLPFAAKSVNLGFPSGSVFTLDLVGFTLAGQLLYSFFTMMLLAGNTFVREREQGTLEAVLLAPANRVAILFGGAVAGALNYFWLLIGVLFSWAVFLNTGVLVNDALAFFASVFLSYLSMVALGMCFEAFFFTQEEASCTQQCYKNLSSSFRGSSFR